MSAPDMPGRIFLTGFMASGKTTVGQLLARRLGRRFIDLDDRIVQRAGKPITQIFAQDGEAAFRRMERELLGQIVREQNVVVGLGGGVFVDEANRRLIKEHGLAIWLDCSFDVILKRLEGSSGRPLNTSPEQMRRLLEDRLPSYGQADYRIDTSQAAPDQVVERIIRVLIPTRVGTGVNAQEGR